MPKKIERQDIKKIQEGLFEIPQSFRADMLVPARFFAAETMLPNILHDASLEQLVNVATLPGIQQYALSMPDIHQGYGFPIGGVAAMDCATGVISPGGIGYDINCGVRLLASTVKQRDAQKKIEKLATDLHQAIPSGTGVGGKHPLLTHELEQLLTYGPAYLVQQGFGTQEDIEHCESNGYLPQANASLISEHAKRRGADQLGTLGSGNHFLEIQVVDEIYDQYAADVMGVQQDCLTVMIHCGSRGLGHQTCTDYVRIMANKLEEWGLTLPDRQLACAPFQSKEGQEYFAAMAACANFAWSNRHMIAADVKKIWERYFGAHSLHTVYDVAHNIGKLEKHRIQGVEKELIVHRKGATRAFGPHNSEIPTKYQAIGQPVFIPGTMGTASYLLVGTEQAMDLSFGSCCHGAGRTLSRSQAKRTVNAPSLRKQLAQQGIILRCESNAELAEEAPKAYKDIHNVVDVIVNAGIAKKVARVRPFAVIKGS